MMNTTDYLQVIVETIKNGPYKANWESLSAYEVPQWYRQAKFGIFIHWGLYSVPAFSNEWYSRNMYIQGTKEYEHHLAVYGNHKTFGYKDFIPLFTAKQFDPAGWAALFKASGARYVIPVAEHHDGFQMYKSAVSHYNTYDMGPGRDILGELKAAFAEQELELGVSSHRAEHWFFMSHGKEFDSDIREPLVRGDFYWPAMPEPDHHDPYGSPPSGEYLEDWLIRCCELVDQYQPKIFTSTGGLRMRPSGPICKSSRPTTTIARQSAECRLLLIISMMPSCSAVRSPMSSAGNSPS